jgi:hypothetical protein
MRRKVVGHIVYELPCTRGPSVVSKVAVKIAHRVKDERNSRICRWICELEAKTVHTEDELVSEFCRWCPAVVDRKVLRRTECIDPVRPILYSLKAAVRDIAEGILLTLRPANVDIVAVVDLKSKRIARSYCFSVCGATN